jgi:hypothetical protein
MNDPRNLAPSGLCYLFIQTLPVHKETAFIMQWRLSYDIDNIFMNADIRKKVMENC